MNKILIVDDEKPILTMYQTTLSDLKDFEILTAGNGEEAISIAKKEQPSLIYLDIIMPKLNGLDVLKRLKDDENTKDIPVVLLTNLPAEASAEKAKTLGALDYFVKVECEPDDLLKKTKQILGI